MLGASTPPARSAASTLAKMARRSSDGEVASMVTDTTAPSIRLYGTLGREGWVLTISFPALSNMLLSTVRRKFFPTSSGPLPVTTNVVTPSADTVCTEGPGVGCGYGCCAKAIDANATAIENRFTIAALSTPGHPAPSGG